MKAFLAIALNFVLLSAIPIHVSCQTATYDIVIYGGTAKTPILLFFDIYGCEITASMKGCLTSDDHVLQTLPAKIKYNKLYFRRVFSHCDVECLTLPTF